MNRERNSTEIKEQEENLENDSNDYHYINIKERRSMELLTG